MAKRKNGENQATPVRVTKAKAAGSEELRNKKKHAKAPIESKDTRKGKAKAAVAKEVEEAVSLDDSDSDSDSLSATKKARDANATEEMESEGKEMETDSDMEDSDSESGKENAAVTLTPKKADVAPKKKPERGKKKAAESAVMFTPKRALPFDEAPIESEDTRNKAKGKAKAAVAKEVAPKKKASVSLDESDSDSDSLSATKKATKEMESEGKEMETDSELDDSDSESGKENAAAVKDVAPKKKATDSERGKKKATEPAVMLTPVKRGVPEPKKEEKSVPFQRKWSDKDEISLLEGMFKYKDERKVDPMSNCTDFYEFVKKSLDGNFVQNQVSSKIKCLRNRYKTYVEGRKKSLNAHEHEAIGLSKRIWGDILKKPAPTVSTKKTTRATMKDVPAFKGKEEVNEKTWKFVDKLHMFLGMEEDEVNDAVKTMSKAEKEVIEETWKQIFLDESSMASRRLEAVNTNTIQIIDIIQRM